MGGACRPNGVNGKLYLVDGWLQWWPWWGKKAKKRLSIQTTYLSVLSLMVEMTIEFFVPLLSFMLVKIELFLLCNYFIFLLIYFLFLVLNSPPRLAGAFFSILEWIRRLCCFYHTEVVAVWWGLGAAWREQRKRTRSLELFLWFDLFTGWTEEDRASWREESFVLCFVFYTLLFLADSVMGVGGWHQFVWSAGLESHPQDLLFFFSGCSTGCYSIFSSTTSCLYINRKKLFGLFTFVQKKRERKRKWNQIWIGCFCVVMIPRGAIKEKFFLTCSHYSLAAPCGAVQFIHIFIISSACVYIDIARRLLSYNNTQTGFKGVSFFL